MEPHVVSSIEQRATQQRCCWLRLQVEAELGACLLHKLLASFGVDGGGQAQAGAEVAGLLHGGLRHVDLQGGGRRARKGRGSGRSNRSTTGGGAQSTVPIEQCCRASCGATHVGLLHISAAGSGVRGEAGP